MSEQIGNANRSGEYCVPELEYKVCGVFSTQVDAVDAIYGNKTGGLAQRMLVAPADDPRPIKRGGAAAEGDARGEGGVRELDAPRVS